MVYGRDYGDRELSFEASGALLDASLVMRDRETDSWWSIMSSTAIGGELDGTDLETLTHGEKLTWKDWLSRHPETLVLTVEGEEYVESSHYDNYMASDGTFRDMEVDDDRLPPKTPVYAFHRENRAWAVPHSAFEGGRLFTAGELGDRAVLLHRAEEAPIYESSRAWLVAPELAARELGSTELLAMADSGPTAGLEPLAGFDTFWYTWVAVNKWSRILD